MHYFFRQLAAFLVVILVTVMTMGFSLVNFTSNEIYEREEARLLELAASIMVQPLSQDYLSDIELILQGNNVKVAYYDASDQLVYPGWDQIGNGPQNNALNTGERLRLRQGRYLGLRAYDMGFSNDNNDAWSVFVPIRDSQGNYQGYLVLGTPTRLVDKFLLNLQDNIVKGFTLAALVAIVLSAAFAHYQQRRFSEFSRATKEIAAGDYDISLTSKGRDTIDYLAADFNTMIASLKASQAEVLRQQDLRQQLMLDVAHEMRTPLTTMNGILEGFAHGLIKEDKREQSMRLLYNETNRLIRLVNENLDYEKILNEDDPLHRQVFKVQPVLADILLQMESIAQDQGNQMILDCSEEIEVYADFDRFRQIFVNLLKNANQFTEHGKIKVTADYDQGLTKIAVADTGIGMSTDQQAHIFERFYKADASRKNSQYGEAGIGLALVAKLLERHQADIMVDSQLGQGSTFTVSFKSEKLIKE
ncbi:hypothetical protein AWM75_05280 [Aerococcus urinaehominis]|uniref:histidine kinase n=1 Tax=Aerococcus urinaehominis TaxID=128944 RepID=A0A109RGX9_9LACT|nr:HAMP domain-containing sensor histidine kinase [Aerococcus urinaehominis]AMB99441.1 hypothetical protein AWM75_05280 [Aerococcus urinaehominis]SDM28891.1 Signal transduction histidine kinase [Aerococcus urinaehominis]